MRILLMLMVALISMKLFAQESQTLDLKVYSAPDGSTVQASHRDEGGAIIGGTYRLFGIQSPIKDENKDIEQPYWKESKAHLSKIDGFMVRATSKFVGGMEYWVISLLDGTNVNLEMIHSGNAWYQPAHGDFPILAQAQQHAKEAKKGLWGLPNPIAPWKYNQFQKDEFCTSKLPTDPTAAQTRIVLIHAAAELHIATLWDGLPKKYQGDIESVIQLTASSWDAEAWNGVKSVLQTLSKLASDKKTKENFMKNLLISQYLPILSESNENWEAFAELLHAFATCSLTDHLAMKGFSMDGFIATDLFRMQTALSKLPDALRPFAKELPKVEAVNATTSEATLRITLNGAQREERWLKVDRRWLPANIVEGWDDQLEQMREYGAAWSTPKGQEYQENVKLLHAIYSQALLRLDSQQEFDNQVGLLLMLPLIHPSR